MTPLTRVVTALEEHGCRREGGNWTCPAHEDRQPSLSVSAGPDGRVLLHCHAGCAIEDVLCALGLVPADLFDAPPSGNGSLPARPIEATYRYRDEQGVVLFEVVRFVPKDFRQRRPDGKGGWEWKLGDVRRVLYRLPQVIEAVAAGTTIHVVEGEKDVEAIERAGGVATCNPGGAGKWRAEYSESLRGAHVVVVADRDAPGRAHACAVADSLRGVAASVRVVGAAEGKDAADHLAAGHGLDDLVPAPDPDAAEPPLLHIEPAETFAAVDEESADSLLGDGANTVLSAGGMMVIYGTGGAGKTTLELDLAMHMAAGVTWLGIDVPRRCRVLIVENEGPRGKFRHKMRAKLAAWQGPPMGDYLYILDVPWARFTFADPGLRAQLAAVIRDHEIDVLVAGPVQRLGVTGGGTPEEVATFVGLIELVRADLVRPLAVTAVHHTNKSGAVAGAWEGVPDTLVHVSGQGHGATRVEWEKVRWGTDIHGQVWTLLWRPGETFERDETPQVTDEDIRAAVLAAVEEEPGCSWNAIENGSAIAGRASRKRAARDALLDEGAIVNRGGGKGGAGGGGMSLYLADGAPEGAFVPAGTNGGTHPSHPRGGTVRPYPHPPVRGGGGGRTGSGGNARGGTHGWCTTCERQLIPDGPGSPYCRCDEQIRMDES